MVVEVQFDPDDVDTFQALVEEKEGTIKSERPLYEVEGDIDQFLAKYIDLANLHDVVDFELF